MNKTIQQLYRILIQGAAHTQDYRAVAFASSAYTAAVIGTPPTHAHPALIWISHERSVARALMIRVVCFMPMSNLTRAIVGHNDPRFSDSFLTPLKHEREKVHLIRKA